MLRALPRNIVCRLPLMVGACMAQKGSPALAATTEFSRSFLTGAEIMPFIADHVETIIPSSIAILSICITTVSGIRQGKMEREIQRKLAQEAEATQKELADLQATSLAVETKEYGFLSIDDSLAFLSQPLSEMGLLDGPLPIDLVVNTPGFEGISSWILPNVVSCFFGGSCQGKTKAILNALRDKKNVLAIRPFKNSGWSAPALCVPDSEDTDVDDMVLFKRINRIQKKIGDETLYILIQGLGEVADDLRRSEILQFLHDRANRGAAVVIDMSDKNVLFLKNTSHDGIRTMFYNLAPVAPFTQIEDIEKIIRSVFKDFGIAKEQVKEFADFFAERGCYLRDVQSVREFSRFSDPQKCWEETVADIGAMIPYSDPRIRVLVEAILNAKDPHNFELSGEARKYIGIGLEHKLLFVLKASVFFTTPAILEACKIWLKSL
eukprot:TRINITY_DN747_c0_g1_i4.p1 TRINITY_DN747_c0_g1~~TRINITY_DN747_c0_g1_i4.p1  ORF type:complete len:465 (+),score=92.30 TRINITY_DN747_c0_g1_i4:90-1397(+)